MRLASAALAAAGLLLMAGCTAVQVQAQPAPVAGATITVQGEAKVPVGISTATFTAGVQATASTAADALSQDNTQAQAVLAALKKAGVPAANLTTVDLSVQPQYAYSGGGAPRLTGYQASDTVQVKVDDASTVGPVIDAASGAGATQLGAIAFGPPAGDATTQEAMADAVDNARARALAIAREARLTLGEVKSVSTVAQSGPVVPQAYASAQAMVAAPAAPTPVETGSQEVDVQVQVTFAAR